MNFDGAFAPRTDKEETIMKKTILAILVFCAVTSVVHAQQTVIIRRPGILTDLAEAAGAIAALPLVLAEGIVEGTAEAAGALLHSSTQVIVTPPPAAAPALVVVSAPVVVQPSVQVVAPAPVVVQPRVQVVAPAAAVPPTTTIVTTYGDGTSVTVTRPASAYELGGTVIAPVAPEHRVGSSPFVNPYVFRYR